jgi:type III secretion protein R
MERAIAPVPYRPFALAPGMARLCDTLASRAALADGHPRAFHVEPLPLARVPATELDIEAGGFLWRLEFHSLDFLSSNAALAGTDPARLPEALVRAALLLALHPFLGRLENALKTPVNPHDEAASAAPDWLDPVLCFTLDFAPEDSREDDTTRKDRRRWPIPLGLRAASEAGAAWLCARVTEALPRLRENPERALWPLAVTLRAGSMQAPVSLLQNLAVADILIPSDYPAKDGHLDLVLPDGSRFRLDLADGRAVVTDFYRAVHDEEMNMNPPDSPDGKSTLAALEVPIRFELEKKLLPLAEIEALAPGRSFPLGTDPMSAVTVTLHGQALAAGRLVDLGGTLGVQQVPPVMVLNGLAMVLALFIMTPVGLDTWELIGRSGKVEQSVSDPAKLGPMLEAASPPLRGFLQKNTDAPTLAALKRSAQRIWPERYHSILEENGLLLLVPAFVLTELTEAFRIGFLLYLPFVVIDLIISNILLAMGMMMVSPMTISLPFKLLLFVTLDGWLKISQGLMYGYG